MGQRQLPSSELAGGVLNFADTIESSATHLGLIPIGKVGEPLAGKHFNDPVDVEQYFNQAIQGRHKERFGSDLYIDEDYGYQLDASLWKHPEDGGHRYFEALISALYPLSLSMEMVFKTVEHTGRMPDFKGNILRLTYQVPFYRAGHGRLEFTVTIINEDIKDGNVEIDVGTLILRPQEYTSITVNDKQQTVLEIDLDHPKFRADNKRFNYLRVGKSYPFIAKLRAYHQLESQAVNWPQTGQQKEVKELAQPPFLYSKDRDDNTAKKRGDFRIRPAE